MKKKYIVPGLLVIRLSAKQTLLQASFEKGEGGSTPKFYTATNGVRLYAKNYIKITGASKAIAKVILNCDSYNGTDYVGNELLYGLADGLAMFIYNEHTGTSGGVQLRVKTIEITYAE